ncbi:MAG: glycosyltransferase family 2 protein [Terriglobales bacterium]|jgi:glycosyltransferase involved in cell wall biosynthesis
MDVSAPSERLESGTPVVSIIVPARNEEASLGDCLWSLVGQTGVSLEIIVVDDGSKDGTRAIAESFAGVRVMAAPPLPAGWTGKNNAAAAGATAARGEWLLFTDADTVHVAGSLGRAVEEARREDAEMLSYSPEQIAVTFWEMAVLPVVFAELAREYPPKKVSDPASPIAAANGQYILIRREAYEAVGGHRAIADSLLEDVALARAVKKSGRRIRFRYAADAVRTRMYRNFGQLSEGWTKNLALLFRRPGRLAASSILLWGFAWSALLWPMVTEVGVGLTGRVESLSWAHGFLLRLAGVSRHWWWTPIGIGPILFIGQRLRRANFTWDMEVLGTMAGYPMFAYLLCRSRGAHSKGNVSWKGRHYDGVPGNGDLTSAAEADSESSPVI